ncbi:MazG nucleotide pyrophosphohydrolase domain-containing protein [Brachybacterium tyrofermentans]|uniref:MazG nucleotide pyrophosphohydrolase domain-containing protein n=1 Tax=Brachybacterium tyrofermentans TaxID=47848 RepID=UPI003FD2742A
MNASQPPVPSSQPGQSPQPAQPPQPPVQPSQTGQPSQATEPTPGEAARGSALLRAVEVMEALRAADGDAWSHQQTHASLARYLLEETYEVLEVIDDPQAHGPGALRDELGDLLFQILFHARVGQEAEPAWDVDDVARSFIAKMERRNPHIFGDRRDEALEDPEDIEQIIAQWHAVKAAERQARGAGDTPSSAVWFDGIPERLPALQTAAKVVHRARSDGRLEELLAAADEAAAAPDAQQWGGDVASALLEVAVRAESEDIDPESALRALLARTRSAALETDGSAPRDGALQTPGDRPSDGTMAGPDGRTA